jgi:hypothetical protein
MLKKKRLHIVFLLIFLIILCISTSGEILFQENFEDENLANRGWYDNTNMEFSDEGVKGSIKSLYFHWDQGDTSPNGVSIRKEFTETEEIFVSFYVKYSDDYTGSNQNYHPHEIYITTNKDSRTVGPASTHLTSYIEHNEGIPKLAFQDAENINRGCYVNNNEPVTKCDNYNYGEDRSVASCNTILSVGYSYRDCYGSGTRNGLGFDADGIYFQDSQGNYYKGDWHFIEAQFKMNSIQNGIGVPDGEVRYWYDGELLIENTQVLMKTGLNHDMVFKYFLIGPWIGDGSPIAQAM